MLSILNINPNSNSNTIDNIKPVFNKDELNNCSSFSEQGADFKNNNTNSSKNTYTESLVKYNSTLDNISRGISSIVTKMRGNVIEGLRGRRSSHYETRAQALEDKLYDVDLSGSKFDDFKDYITYNTQNYRRLGSIQDYDEQLRRYAHYDQFGHDTSANYYTDEDQYPFELRQRYNVGLDSLRGQQEDRATYEKMGLSRYWIYGILAIIAVALTYRYVNNSLDFTPYLVISLILGAVFIFIVKYFYDK